MAPVLRGDERLPVSGYTDFRVSGFLRTGKPEKHDEEGSRVRDLATSNETL